MATVVPIIIEMMRTNLKKPNERARNPKVNLDNPVKNIANIGLNTEEKIVSYCLVLTKIARDRDKMKRWRQVHRKRKSLTRGHRKKYNSFY